MRKIGLIAAVAFVAGTVFAQTVITSKAITRVSKTQILNMKSGEKISCTVAGKSVIDYSAPSGGLRGVLTLSGELK